MSERSTCPQCSGGTARMFDDAHPWLVCCQACGLGLADPQPTEAELEQIYADDYYEQFGYGDGDDAGLARMKIETYARMLAEVEAVVRPGRVLDVGCALGYSLAAADRRGWDAWGLEPHALAGDALEQRLADRVLRGTLEDFTPEEPFDLVTLVDVIEHVRDPVQTIRQAAGLLRPGGAMMLATNDLSSKGARRLGPRWVHFHRAHLWFFSPDTLSRAAELAGLTVVKVAPARRVYNLAYVGGILARGDNFPLARTISRMLLRVSPRSLRLACWPPLTEGMVVIATRR